MEIRLDFRNASGSSPAASFNGIANTTSTADLFDVETNSTGISYTPSNFGSSLTISFGADNEPAGDASWVPVSVSGTGINVASGGSWTTITFAGSLNPEKRYRWEVYGVASSGDAVLRCRVNGGPPQEKQTNQNQSETLLFEDVEVVAGQIVVEMQRGGESATYVSAGRLVEVESTSPTATITQSELTPGATISGTATNWTEGGPTTATLSAGGHSREVALTPTNVDEGEYSFTGTMPSRPPVNSSAPWVPYDPQATVEVS